MVSSTNANDAAPIRIGLVGLGKISRDQHIPSLGANPQFELVAAATSSKNCPVDIPLFRTLGEMIAGTPGLEAVALCTPPQVRYPLAREALDRGLHVLLEKPPGNGVGEVEELAARAREHHLALFATWHSREAPAVPQACEWITGKTVRGGAIVWKEDVRKWHPGQSWIWRAGGLGVFDPGINALSIVTKLLARRLFVTRSVLHVPSNQETPIAAELTLADGAGTAIDVALDFRQSGDEQWDIQIDTDAGQLVLRDIGAQLEIDGAPVVAAAVQEYPRLYERFAALVRLRAVDVDLAPLKLVADAFLIGRRVTVEPFEE